MPPSFLICVLLCVPFLVGAAWSADAPDVRPKANPPLQVSVDPRVELMSIVFRLAGNPEYGQGRVPSYLADVESHFGAFKDHAVIEMARRLRSTRGVSYDAVMSYAVHLTPKFEPVLPFSPRPVTLDSRWQPDQAEEFRSKLAAFVEDSRFEQFVAAHQPLYQTAVSRMEEVMREHADLGWFDRFFGARPGAQFQVVLGLLNGGACYGARTQPPGDPERLYCVLGVWSVDWLGQPKFDASMLSTVVHEFGHSYVNPLVYAHESDLRAAGEMLYPPVAEAMKRQAYGNWSTVMHESLVRASVIRYQMATEGDQAAERAIRQEVEQRSFLWTRELVQLLGDYEAHRDQYPDFASFFPRVIAFFNDYAPGFEKRMSAQKERAPKVLSMTPVNGAQAVDPALAAITVTFDRPMRGSYSFVGGGPLYPETPGRPSFDETGRIVSLPVKLAPDHAYELWLNRGQFQGFRSQDGVPLESVHVRFRTGPAR